MTVARRRSLVSLLMPGLLGLSLACGGEAPPSSPPPPPPPSPPEIPITGPAVPELQAMDQAVTSLMRAWKIPGGAVAVTYHERLVYARGFGYADTLTGATVQPDALFRIASVSKPFTSVGLLRLAAAGQIDLDAPAFSLIPEITPPAGATVDPRLANITVRQLLWHVGGWDRDASGDPVFQNAQIATALGTARPASATDIIRYMEGRPLDFDPGGRYAYSNFGYMVLGRILEHVTGQPYETWMQANVMAPAGITRMRLGHSRLAQQAAGEVRYYDPGTAESVWPGEGTVPFAYGGFYLESMDSHGGWLASVIDLAKFLTSVDGGPVRPDLVSGPFLLQMLAAPPGVWTGSSYFYGLGWLVRPDPGNWWHNGSLPGTASFVARYASGITVAAVFNARAMVPNSQFESLIDPTLGQALNAVPSWPNGDQFSTFP